MNMKGWMATKYALCLNTGVFIPPHAETCTLKNMMDLHGFFLFTLLQSITAHVSALEP